MGLKNAENIQLIVSKKSQVQNDNINFRDLRGGQEGTGDTQTLIVWTTGGKDFD